MEMASLCHGERVIDDFLTLRGVREGWEGRARYLIQRVSNAHDLVVFVFTPLSPQLTPSIFLKHQGLDGGRSGVLIKRSSITICGLLT
jgi:hypothetical protein